MSRWKKIKNKDTRERIYKYFTDNDFVQVVRCKDCEHYQKAPKGFVYGSCDYMHGHIDIDENDYCSLAERRAEDG